MDGYILDLCLLDPSTAPDALAEDLRGHRTADHDASPPPGPSTSSPTREPDRAAQAFREAITDGWADVVGGAWAEVDEPFLPWGVDRLAVPQGVRGSTASHLDDRNGRDPRPSAVRALPPVAAGRPTVRVSLRPRCSRSTRADSRSSPESKRLWGSPDGTSLESLTRHRRSPPTGRPRGRGSPGGWASR